MAGTRASFGTFWPVPEPLSAPFGRKAVAIAAGNFNVCAILDDGTVKCWGGNTFGPLGLGDTRARGDAKSDLGDALPAVDLGTGRTARAVTSAGGHTCALLDTNAVKCWGMNYQGSLGLGDANDRGDGPGEMGDNLPAIPLGSGRTPLALAAGLYRSCAILDDRTVKCWGSNTNGLLGLGDTNHRGDAPGELGDALPAIDLGAGRTVRALAAGGFHACALLDNSAVKCWGANFRGALGLGDTSNRGRTPREMGDNLPAIDLGARMR